MRRKTGWVCGALALATLTALTACTASAADPPATTTGSVTSPSPSPSASPLSASPVGSTGSPSPSSTTSSAGVDDAFRAKADAACRPYAEYNLAHPFSFTGFDPEHPDLEVLPAIGDFFDRNPANHTLIPALAALGEPARGAAEWHTVLEAIGRQQQLAMEQISVARAKDAPGWAANIARTRLQTSAVTTAFAAAGFEGAADLCAGLY